MACSLLSVLLLYCMFAVVPTSIVGLKVSVFYETLCGDSSYFIKEKLEPTWLQLKDFLHVDWVPFGKAFQTETAEGKWQFNCQHGQRECEGNKLHACALEKLNSSSEQTNLFIFCSMGHGYPPSTGRHCSETVGANFTDIEICATSEEGDRVLAKYGQRTIDLDPVLTYVPTVVVNGSKLMEPMHDFKRTLCNHIRHAPPCSDHGTTHRNN